MDLENQREVTTPPNTNTGEWCNMFYNSRHRCIVCFKPPTDGFQLMKHHITYFPEMIAFVHYDCHNKIHDPDNPLTTFIQYEAGDSREFYNNAD